MFAVLLAILWGTVVYAAFAFIVIRFVDKEEPTDEDM